MKAPDLVAGGHEGRPQLLALGAQSGQLVGKADGESRRRFIGLLGAAERFGIADTKASSLLK